MYIYIYTYIYTHIYIHGKGNGNPIQYSCLAGYSPWGHKRVRYNLATKQQLTYM